MSLGFSHFCFNHCYIPIIFHIETLKAWNIIEKYDNLSKKILCMRKKKQ